MDHTDELGAVLRRMVRAGKASTDRRLDLLTHRVFSLARAIEWRWLNDCWAGVGPDVAWMCRGCGYAECAWRLG